MLYFENVSLLGYSHTPQFTGAGLRYRINKVLTFKGILIDKQNPGGVGSLLAKEDAIIASAVDYDDIIIAGVNFGKGKIINIEFDGGKLVRRENYTYTVICYEEGDLSNAETGVYTGIDWSTLSPRQLEAFSEEITSSQGDTGDLQFSHTVSVQYSEYTNEADGIAMAKAFAAVMFNAYSGIGQYLQGLSNYHYANKLYTENYSLVDCVCEFSENITIPNQPAGNYSYSLSYSISVGEDGFITVAEDVSIQGLSSPRNAGAEVGYLALKGGAYTRCAAVFSAYGFSNAQLFTSSIQSSRTNNKFAGTIEFSNTFSNNPKYQDEVVWEYTLDLSRNEDGVYTVSEKGSILGYGKVGAEKYQKALDFFNSNVKVNVDNRLQDLYNTTGRTLPLTLVSQSLEKDEFTGSIQYSYIKTDSKLNSNSTYKRTSIQVQISNPIHINPKFKIFNYKEIIQPQNQSTLGKVSVNIELKGSRATPLSVFLTDAKTIALSYKPAGESFLEDCQYTYSPNVSEFSFEAAFAFTGAKESSDLSID